MRTIGILAILTAFLAVSGCASSIVTDYDPSYDFTTYRTYRWFETKLQPGDALAANPLARKRVVEAVDRALAEKGFRLVTEETSDFLVFVHAAIRDRVQMHDTAGMYYFHGPFLFGSHNVYVNDYDEETLFVDVIDFKSRELVWRGSLARALQNYKDPEKAQAVTDEIVRRILEDFPPIRG